MLNLGSSSTDWGLIGGLVTVGDNDTLLVIIVIKILAGNLSRSVTVGAYGFRCCETTG